MILKEILKEEEKELLYKLIDAEQNAQKQNKVLSIDNIVDICMSFIQSYNEKIIKAVTNEMIGEKIMPECECNLTYNDRVQEEIEKEKEILTKL